MLYCFATSPVQVRTLIPPAGSEPGDVVFLEGGAPSSAVAKQVKSDDWKKIVAALSVQVCGPWLACCQTTTIKAVADTPLFGCVLPSPSQASKATYGGTAFVTAKGGITLPALIPDGAGIH